MSYSLQELHPVWLYWQTLVKNSPQDRLWHTQLLVAFSGAALKKLPHMLHSLLWRARSSWAYYDAQTPITLEFFMPLADAVPHRQVLSKFGLKTLVHSHNWLCFCVLKQQKTFSAPVGTIFIQPAPLAATNETKHLWHVQMNLESFFFYMWVTCWILYAIQV
jgi:hypothetical protein